MGPAEVLHHVLEITHIPQEVGAHLASWSRPGGWRRTRRARGTIGELALRRWVARHESRDEDSDEGDGEWEGGKEVRIEADKSVDGEEGEGLRGAAPKEKADGARLEFEDNADAGVEAGEIGGHGSGRKRWAGGLVGGGLSGGGGR